MNSTKGSDRVVDNDKFDLGNLKMGKNTLESKGSGRVVSDDKSDLDNS